MPSFPQPSWEDFSQQFAKRWKQGEHVFISAQTGAGKTDLMLKLFDLKPNWYSVVMVTKPRDPIFKTAEAKTYKSTNVMEVSAAVRRQMLAARNGKNTSDTMAKQQEVFTDAFDRIYEHGGYLVGIDELAYMSQYMRLSEPIGAAHHMGRALGLTYVAATQRPKRVPVIVPQSASHAFIAKTGRKDDLVTLAELGGDPNELRAAIASLRGQHDFVYVDTQSELPIQIVNSRRR